MKSYVSTAALVSVALFVAGCQPAAEQPEPAAEVATQAEDVAAIEALADQYIASVASGDASALAALFTDDAVLMPPEAPVATGKEGVNSYYQPTFDQFTNRLTVSGDETQLLGDWAFRRGSYTVTRTPKAGGNSTEAGGKWLSICKRQPDGSWKIARHIWNWPAPPPLPGE